MMKAKEEMPYIQDYSLSETSLEEVFLFFAKNQRREGEEDEQQLNGGFVNDDDESEV